MGLDIAVGVLALEKQSADPEDVAELMEPFTQLNLVLGEAGRELHREPVEVAQTFEAQMFGYGGLHAVRRLAAWIEIEGRLPPEPGGQDASEDPVLQALNQRLLQYDEDANAVPVHQLLDRLLRRKTPPRSGFQHLLWHSDTEGFYVPQPFDEVVFDHAEIQRPFVGGMVGSSFRLLEDCRRLADQIELPITLDPESDILWEAAGAPSATGPLWGRYGVEAFCLARLLRASSVSIETGAAIVFR
jgi:hypothetical protein